jgi:hypothetical protein
MKSSLIAVSLLLYASLSFGGGHSLSDEQIRHLLITESIRAFPGSCPCPYSIERKKKRLFCGKKCKTKLCGGKSAWSWSPAGFIGPLCYRSDVSDEMVLRFQQGGYGGTIH